MKTLKIFLFGLGLFLLQNLWSQTSYPMIQSMNLKHTIVAPYKNVVKIFDVTVDDVRGLVYTSGILTEYVSVIDIATGREVQSVILPFSPQLHVLICNPANGYLLAKTIQASPVTIYAIEPSTSTVTGTYTYSSGGDGIAFDRYQNLVFVGDGNVIQVLNGDDLSSVRAFNAGMPVGGIEVDTTNALIYTVSRNVMGGNAVVKVFSLIPPHSLKRTINVPTTVSLGNIILDVPNNRFFLIGMQTIKVVDMNTGSVLATQNLSAEVSSAVYSSQFRILFLTDEDGYSDNGEGGSWSKIYRYYPDTGTLDSIKMGDKSSQLAIDNRQNVLAVPSMHSAIVELWHLDTHTIDTVDVGETADAFALSPDGQSLYIVNRLGGSKIIQWKPRDATVDLWRAGNWPCVAVVDSALNKLFVLNEFESSITVFDCSSMAVLDTIALPIPEGRTDAIPVMALDTVNHKIYVVFPEFASLIQVNAKTQAVVNHTIIPGFHYNEDLHYGIGVIQLLPVPAHNQLWIAQKQEKVIKIFDLSTLTFMDTLNLSSSWPGTRMFDGDLLAYDPWNDRIFLGNVILDPTTRTRVGHLPAGDRVLGFPSDRSTMYSLALESDTLVVYEHDPIGYHVSARRILFKPQGSALPVFLFDANNNYLYIGEFNYAVVRQYDLNHVVGIESAVTLPTQVSLFPNYPNPFNPGTTIRFQLGYSGHVSLMIYDALGRQVRVLVDEPLHAGIYQVHWDGTNAVGKPVSSGMYWYRLMIDGQVVQTRKMVLQK